MTRAGSIFAGAGIIALLVGERVWRRRAPTQAEPGRVARNVALGVMSLGVVAAVQKPLAGRLAARVEDRRLGVAQALPAPAWVRDAAAFLLLDWTMYHWHVATHRVPLLWRLHLVHHSDLDMDASTALRFHAVDMGVSVPLRLAQVRLLGVSPRALAIWEAFFFGSVLFHHSNLKLGLDGALAAVLTTPGMHDIHHRADLAASDRNYSSGLSVWDRLHGTFSMTPIAAPVGVPGMRDPLGITTALALPFARQPDAWAPSTLAVADQPFLHDCGDLGAGAVVDQPAVEAAPAA